MRKWIQIGLPLLVVLALFYPFLGATQDVELTVYEEVAQPFLEQVTVQSKKRLESSYQMHMDEVEEYLSYGPVSYMNVEELTVFRQSDPQKRAVIVEKVKQHIEKQKKSFDGYGVTQMELLENAIVEERGYYIFCLIGTEAEEVWQAFLEVS